MRQLASCFGNLPSDPFDLRHWADVPEYGGKCGKRDWAQKRAREQGGMLPEDRVDFVDVDRLESFIPKIRAIEVRKDLEDLAPECP
eukprot:gene52632-23861_t